MSETVTNGDIRALLGTLLLIGSMFLMVYCCYKLAVCREEEDKNRIKVMPVTTCKHCGNKCGSKHGSKTIPIFATL